MFVRNYRDCRPVVNHGRLYDWVIFTKRRGDQPDYAIGGIMINIDHYSHATLLPEIATEPTAHAGQAEFLYVIEGQGWAQADDGRLFVKDGSAVQIPAGAEHVIANTGNSNMELLTMRRAPMEDGSEDKFVVRNWREPRDEEQRKALPEGSVAHWYHLHKGPFVGAHGIHAGLIPARKIPHPHPHPPGTDEIWYVAKGEGWHWIGEELEYQGPGYAAWIPPETTHSLINVSNEWLEYLYCSWAEHWGLRLRPKEKA